MVHSAFLGLFTKVHLPQGFSHLFLEKTYRPGCTQTVYAATENPWIVAEFHHSVADKCYELVYRDPTWSYILSVHARAMVESDHNRTKSANCFRASKIL